MKTFYQCSACILSLVLVISHVTEAADKLAAGRFKPVNGHVKRFSDLADLLGPPLHTSDPEPSHIQEQEDQSKSLGLGGSMMEEFLVYLTMKDSGLLDMCLGEFKKK